MDIDFFLPKNKSEKGGPGSGNHGHGGLPGVHGGSVPKKGGAMHAATGEISASTRRIMNEEYIRDRFGTGNMTTSYTIHKWASAGTEELNRLGEFFAEKYGKKTIENWLKETDSVLETETGGADFTKEPSEYIQALLNRREVLNMASSYRKGGGYKV